MAFLLAVFALVCLSALVLRRDCVQGEHFTAPTAILALGVVVNVALLLYVLVNDFRALIGGETGALQSVTGVAA